MKIILVLLFSILLISCGGGGGGQKTKLSTNACSQIGLNAKIINGTACSERNSPVVKISLLNEDGILSLCTGSMISKEDVLTAAHCFITDTIQSASIEANGKTIFGEQVFVHPGARFDEAATAVFDDAAILHLREPTNLPTLPIILNTPVEDGDVVSIFGYGLDENGNLEVLKSGQMRVASVTPNHLFAKFNGKGSNTCNGDSGGPAIINVNSSPGIVGVTSSGSQPMCSKGDISLFANIQNDSIADFIREVVPSVKVK